MYKIERQMNQVNLDEFSSEGFPNFSIKVRYVVRVNFLSFTSSDLKKVDSINNNELELILNNVKFELKFQIVLKS